MDEFGAEGSCSAVMGIGASDGSSVTQLASEGDQQEPGNLTFDFWLSSGAHAIHREIDALYS